MDSRQVVISDQVTNLPSRRKRYDSELDNVKDLKELIKPIQMSASTDNRSYTNHRNIDDSNYNYDYTHKHQYRPKDTVKNWATRKPYKRTSTEHFQLKAKCEQVASEAADYKNMKLSAEKEVIEKEREIKLLKEKLSSTQAREKLLNQSLLAFEHFSLNGNAKSLYLPVEYKNSKTINGDNNRLEVLSALLKEPCANDKTLINQVLITMNLIIDGHGNYAQAALHPNVPSRELFSSLAVNDALSVLLNSSKSDKINSNKAEAMKIIIAASSTIAIELLRASDLIVAPNVKLPPVINTGLWVPDKLCNTKQDDNNIHNNFKPSKIALCSYLKEAVKFVEGKAILPPEYVVPKSTSTKKPMTAKDTQTNNTTDKTDTTSTKDEFPDYFNPATDKILGY